MPFSLLVAVRGVMAEYKLWRCSDYSRKLHFFPSCKVAGMYLAYREIIMQSRNNTRPETQRRGSRTKRRYSGDETF
jgi:hypothetical protein